MKRIAYFGYGSLVNRDTLRTDYHDAVRAELKGFRREWRIRSETAVGPVSTLTAAFDDDAAIQGLVVIDRIENLPAVDLREDRYDRVTLTRDHIDLHDVPDIDVEALYVYVAKSEHLGGPDPRYPIWQSYVDAVMQGFLVEFGEDGLRRFVHETHCWDHDITPDRDKPLYPRAVETTAEERHLFDTLLAEVRGT